MKSKLQWLMIHTVSIKYVSDTLVSVPHPQFCELQNACNSQSAVPSCHSTCFLCYWTAYLQSFCGQIALGYVSNRQRENIDSVLLEYDACLVWLQGLAPINFPHHPYDVQEICRPTDLAEFLQQKRERASELTKSRQSSRLAPPGHLLPCAGVTVLLAVYCCCCLCIRDYQP